MQSTSRPEGGEQAIKLSSLQAVKPKAFKILIQLLIGINF